MYLLQTDIDASTKHHPHTFSEGGAEVCDNTCSANSFTSDVEDTYEQGCIDHAINSTATLGEN